MGLKNIAADTRFVRWLLATGALTEIEVPDDTAELVVLYFNKALPVHAGIRRTDGRIISKWGTHPAYEHGLSDVPGTYGGWVRYFQKPTADEARRLFQQYLAACDTLPDWARPTINK